jgi:hypothetical protein
MGRAGVHDEDGQPLARHVERNVFHRKGSAVEKQRVPGARKRGRRLIHDAAGHAHVHVFGALGQCRPP